ncbi:MAG: glycosyltransferase family 1 protein, partial [Verrucomicrobiota bacterium]
IQDLAVLIPVTAPLAPYFLELKREAPNLRWLRELSRSVHQRDLAPLSRKKVAWLSDTLEDVNGVSTTICKLSVAGREEGFDVTVLSCRSNSNLKGVPLRNFTPIGEFELPEYELQKLAFPPVLEMIEYIYREGFTELILSTPGPLGLVGLFAARLLGLPVRGIYHTDFPRYIRILTEDSDLESLTWAYMHWFYTGLDEFYVNSEPYREAWIARGAAASKLRILPRGLDTQLFNPERRDAEYWVKRGAPHGVPVLLYVGRVSKEKDLDMLIALAARLGVDGATLAVVGDGPYRTELQERIPSAIFTGYLYGEELAAAYASSDVFVFPSTTDTYGNVVMEALASGIPCVVSDAGGPKGLVAHGKTGFVTKARDVESFIAHTTRLALDPKLRHEMMQSVSVEMKRRDWAEAARVFFGKEKDV